MFKFVQYFIYCVFDFFRDFLFLSDAAKTAEILALRSQLAIIQLEIDKGNLSRPKFTLEFKTLWVWYSLIFKSWEKLTAIMSPATVKRWHKNLYRLYWTWISGGRKPGRPEITTEMKEIIKKLCEENPLWSPERIHDHLVPLYPEGVPCANTIAKYMPHPRGNNGDRVRWLTFIRTHLHNSWGIDFFTVPTLTFRQLFLFVVLDHNRRQVLHFAVSANPTSAWVIQQIREAMPFDQKPKYLFRDNDGIYGKKLKTFLEACGVEEVKTAFRCPHQNPFVERFGGTLRRELLNHVIPLNEAHLEVLVREFIDGYYHPERPHLGLDGESPIPTPKQQEFSGPTELKGTPVLGGLHHTYERVEKETDH